MATAPYVGRRVRISGLSARPELNDCFGRAESFNEETSRYNVRIEQRNELIALRPANITPVDGANAGARARGGGEAPPRRAGWSMPTMPAMPAGIDPRHLAVALMALLMMGGGFSFLNAALLSGLAYAAYTASQREGGLSGEAKRLATGAATAIQRVTGTEVTPGQAAFLVIGVIGLVWYYWIGFGSSSTPPASSSYSGYRGSSSDYRGSSSSGRTYGSRDSRGFDRSPPEQYESGSFFGSGWDLSFMLSAAMLGMYCYRLGGGGTPQGWSAGQLVDRVRNMDLWQMMMFMNLVQSVLGGRRRHGMGYGRRSMFY